ncbi:hypothetical protein CCMSSC00406_0006471 [Pleurotus cornucopiae]|uniref:Uncharacterized protein n=1 Tax=Pleurotus cornucopiae TaxID=5321 RepID=A0ACB7J5P9_PLECO|nr:hypothetical protein CCMSSC00406_0006471 [Pleurotus cornucopiae]
MAVNANEDTEFNDALRKYGILPPRPPTPPSPSPPPSPQLDDFLDDFTNDELQELADDTNDDEAEKLINAFREQRLAEERNKGARFGRVYPIGRDDYTREVTEASEVDEDDDEAHTGTAVICFLYKDGLPRSERAYAHIRTLAERHPNTKFVSIIGDKCIPNLPESRVPMIIVYRKGEVVTQILSWGADKERSLDELAAMLAISGAIQLEPSRPKPKRSDDDSDEDEEDESHSKWGAASRAAKPSIYRDRQTGSNTTKKNLRSKNDDSDSDFEFDL